MNGMVNPLNQAGGLFKGLGLTVEDLKQIVSTIFEKEKPLELSWEVKGETEQEHEVIKPRPMVMSSFSQVDSDYHTETARVIQDEKYTFTRMSDGNIEVRTKKNNRIIRIGEGEPREYADKANATFTLKITRGPAEATVVETVE